MRSWCPCKYERAAVVTSFTGLRFSPVQRLVSDSSTHLHARPAAPQPIVASKLQPGTRRTPYTFKETQQSTEAPPTPLFKQMPAEPVASTSSPSLRRPQSKDELASLALSAALTELDMEVATVATLIYEIQELRHAAAAPATKTSSPSNGKAPETSNVDQALMKLDARLETIAKEMETALTQADGLDSESFVGEKLESLQEDWTRVQADAEMLREELKEDKWLVVFRTVGQQADEMMDSLERVLSTCHAFIWNVNRRPKDSNSSGASTNGVAGRLAASKTANEDQDSMQTLLSSFVSLHRSFHSKQKYYVPSTDRVLSILGKGISERSMRNGEVLRRYADMKSRWRNLQDRMSRVEREMAGFEELLREAAPGALGAKAEPALLTSPKTNRSVSARAASPFRKLGRSSTKQPAPPMPNVPTGLPGTPSSSSSASDSPDRFKTWKRSAKAPRESIVPSSPALGHRYSQSAQVTPRLTSSFFGPGEDSPSTRAMSPPLSRVGEKPRWNTSTRLDKGEEKTLPPVARRQSSFAFLSSEPPSRARSPVLSNGRRTPLPNRPSSPSTVSVVSGRSVSHGTYKARPSSPSRIPGPGGLGVFGLTTGDDPDASEEMPTSMMQRALSPTPSSFTGSMRAPRSSLSPTKPDTRALLGLRNMVQTPEPSLSARAKRIEGLYAGSPRPSRIATPTRPRASGVVSPTMLNHATPSGPYAPNPRDPLDVEVSNVLNRQPLRVRVERVDPPLPRGRMLDPGEAVKYRFAGGKEVQLKLVERRGKEAKVLARVGGLWQDFELFLVRYGPAPMSSSSSSSGSYGKHSSTRKRRLAD